MNPDFVEMLSELSAAGAEFLAVIGREDLIRNKRATGRPQDLLDAESLERHRE